MDFGGIVLGISSLCFTYTMVLSLCFSFFYFLNKSIWTLVVHITSKGVQNKVLLNMLNFTLPLVPSISHQLCLFCFYSLLTTLENLVMLPIMKWFCTAFGLCMYSETVLKLLFKLLKNQGLVPFVLYQCCCKKTSLWQKKSLAMNFVYSFFFFHDGSFSLYLYSGSVKDVAMSWYCNQ